MPIGSSRLCEMPNMCSNIPAAAARRSSPGAPAAKTAPHCCSLKARWLGSRPSSLKNQRSQNAGTISHSSASSSIRYDARHWRGDRSGSGTTGIVGCSASTKSMISEVSWIQRPSGASSWGTAFDPERGMSRPAISSGVASTSSQPGASAPARSLKRR